ncbi:KICSTOR subunit 2-like [Oratosquilla oratoria]|uniref:KICSTOR subunit 2-like n=1 Tax=Oratosquilla oratoria TaxID=337810 RepID=UPI003F75B261
MASASQTDEKEEAFLQLFFSHFSYFGYDKAKEMADRERTANSSCSSSLIWPHLLPCLSQLAGAEKQYITLSFLTTKSFLRKESCLRATYESLKNDMIKLKDPGEGCSSLDGVLSHLCSHILLFLEGRLHLIAFYEHLMKMGHGRIMDFEGILRNITEISTQNCRNFHHPLFTPVKTMFTHECDILVHLLQSQAEMQHWKFLPSLLHLHDAHSKLTSWHVTVHSKETKKYGFGSSFLKPAPLPALYQWLWQVKAAYVSKFSLYFYETLAAQTTSTEMKALMSRQACDYVLKIQSFQRKTDAAYFSIVFEAAGVDDYQGPGYHYPSRTSVPPKGLESYPAIFSYPQNKPLSKWPSVVMRISDRNSECSLLDKVDYFHDQQLGSTYFLCQIEPRFTIVVIYDSKKSEKDNYIRDFIYELALQLRCNKVFANLKPK